MDEEIVILGNGFDLSCELKSSYRNFFNKRYYGVYDKRTKLLILIFNELNRL